MKNNTYKITILTNLKGNLDSVLENTIGFAKMLNAEITLFHVIKPSGIVHQENQLTAIRTINSR